MSALRLDILVISLNDSDIALPGAADVDGSISMSF